MPQDAPASCAWQAPEFPRAPCTVRGLFLFSGSSLHPAAVSIQSRLFLSEVQLGLFSWWVTVCCQALHRLVCAPRGFASAVGPLRLIHLELFVEGLRFRFGFVAHSCHGLVTDPASFGGGHSLSTDRVLQLVPRWHVHVPLLPIPLLGPHCLDHCHYSQAENEQFLPLCH